ncbi:MAG: hypothetical protein RJA70_2559 [Pseudomonadota bacterium]
MNPQLFDTVLTHALQEDLSAADLTTEATVEPSVRARALATAKSSLVVCGAAIFAAAFQRLDAGIEFRAHLPEGARAEPGEPIWQVSGNARALLMAERTALNFAQRLSGIATLTRQFVHALPSGSKTRITDTRKTTPGLRALERYAVRTGGGYNHRDNLGSAVLIKDNHIVAAGGVESALANARARAPHTCKLEIEVVSLQMLAQALEHGADIVMLDNFAPDEVQQAVRMAAGIASVEVSGGITLERVASLAEAGVDIISVGALTHSARAADISLGIQLIDESI